MTPSPKRVDIEFSKEGGFIDLVPATPKGAAALSHYLGSEVELRTPIRLADDRYGDFTRSCLHFAHRSRQRVTIGRPRTHLGQRAGQSGPTEPILEELNAALVHGPPFHPRNQDFTVRQARYGPPTPHSLYKVTPSEYVPSVARTLSLGTLEYYRGTVDPEEGAFTPSVRDVTLRADDSARLPGPIPAELGKVGVNPSWIYCTTEVPTCGMTSEQFEWFSPGETHATSLVPAPDTFSLLLGSAFGIWSRPRIRHVYKWIASPSELRQTQNAILVVHGPVRYMNGSDRDAHLERLYRQPGSFAPLEQVFTKAADFSPEREYRFAIWGWGAPLRNQILLPLATELLNCFGSTVPVAALRPSA